jgi:hypothetical protein
MTHDKCRSTEQYDWELTVGFGISSVVFPVADQWDDSADRCSYSAKVMECIASYSPSVCHVLYDLLSRNNSKSLQVFSLLRHFLLYNPEVTIKLNGVHHLLVYPGHVKLLCENLHTIKKNKKNW